MRDLRVIRDDPSFSGGKYTQDEDAFDHEAFANTLFKVIQQNEPPLTIGLFGGWGVGKSSIINRLEAKCVAAPSDFAFIGFNAWAYSGDSLRRQLLLAIAKGLTSNDSEREAETDKLRKLNYAQVLEELGGHSIQDLIDKARGGGGFLKAISSELKAAREHVKLAEQGVLGLLLSLAFFLVGIGLIAYGGYKGDAEIQKWSLIWFFLTAANLFVPKVENIFVLKKREVFDARLIFPEQFEHEYNRLMDRYASGLKKVVIVIDDLDRCDEETIKNVLVTLKNFMGKGKSVFVVPMDDSSVVRMFQGKNANFGYEQLRKYFSISLRIPTFHTGDLLAFAHRISKEYEIPPGVAYVAAQGYCRDARKMKHFLNLYKLKHAVADERSENGYLGSIQVNGMELQLAKIVVLEYQYPEFFRFVSTYPEWIDLFTRAARGDVTVDFKNIPLKELGDDIKSIDDLWRTQNGLRQFLRATHDISFEDFEIVSRLKTTRQEHRLGEVGIELRNAITRGATVDFERLLSEDNVKNKGQSIVDATTRYFDPDVPPAATSATRIALEILERNKLSGENQSELFRETVSIVTHPKSSMKITGKESSIFLENIDKLGQLQEVDLVKKIVKDVFVEDVYDREYWRIVSHPAFKKVLALQTGLGDVVDSVAQKWYVGLKTRKENDEFVAGIKQVNLTRAEREAIGLTFPSNDLLALITTSIMSEMNESNIFVLDCILDENNPQEFDDEKIGLGKRLASIFLSNCEEGLFNQGVDFASEGIHRMPDWLDDESADSVGAAITGNLANVNDDGVKQKLLKTLLICACSLSDSSPNKKAFQTSYVDLASQLSAPELERQISIVDSAFPKDKAVQDLIRQILKLRWTSVVSDIGSPSAETIADATLCRGQKVRIGTDEYNKLLPALTGLSSGEAVKVWQDFVVEETQGLPDADRVNAMDRLLVSLSDESLNEDARNAHGSTLLRLLKIFDVRFGMTYYEKMFAMLASSDLVLVRFIQTGYSDLNHRFGSEVPERNANLAVDTLIGLDSLASYRQSIDAVLLFSANVESTVWHRLVQKLISELPNESLDVGHREQLLHLASGVSDAGSQAPLLSQVLVFCKDKGPVAQLSGKSWEIYDLLTNKGVIPRHVPPAREEPVKPEA